MIGVDIIGQIRRAYFDQRRPIKEIMRPLSVSRATVRKMVLGQATAFRYERGVQPAPSTNSRFGVETCLTSPGLAPGRRSSHQLKRSRAAEFCNMG